MKTLWEFSILRLDSATRVSGVLIRNSGDFKFKSNFLRVIESYFFRPIPDFPVKLKCGDLALETKTEKHGAFEFIFDDNGDGEVQILDGKTNQELKARQQTNTTFDFSQSTLHVVTDIDDTILVSNSPNFFKRILTLLLIGPSKRKPIEVVHDLLKEQQKEHSGFYYVSRSESNLIQNHSTFIKEHHLPSGEFFLTSFLKPAELVFGQKNKDHKRACIEFLLQHTGEKKFILIGDDGQSDIRVYTEICAKYTNRIEKVFIHQTIGHISAKKRSVMKELSLTGADVVYFRDEPKFNLIQEL